ncbi:MAG: hypothetical protein M1119_02275 [Firmicutes bacterium]|nr:hypothetical protein [Bacillota bacterium]
MSPKLLPGVWFRDPWNGLFTIWLHAVACAYSRPKNIPACYESLPGYPEDYISPFFKPECKKFCRYAQGS